MLSILYTSIKRDLRRNAYSTANCMDRVSAAFGLLTTCFNLLEVHTSGEALPFSPFPYIRSCESSWNSWEKSGQKLGIFPRNLLGFLRFHANEEAGKMSNFSWESLDKIPAFPEAGKMIVTENIHQPFPGILAKPGSRKLEIGPPVSWESWEESTKISPGKLGLLRKLGKIHHIFLGKPGKIHPVSWECQNLSETVDKLNGHIHVKGLVPRF